MDSTVEAAIIGVAGTVLIGALGFLATLQAARRGAEATQAATAQANTTAVEVARLNLEADHERRLWEKRSELYVDMLSETNQRGFARQLRLRGFRLEGQDQATSDITIDQAQQALIMMARVRAFASQDVTTAYEAAHQANVAAYTLDAEWRRLAEAARDDRGGGEAQELARTPPYGGRVKAAVDAASQADVILIETVRRELNGEPPMDPNAIEVALSLASQAERIAHDSSGRPRSA